MFLVKKRVTTRVRNWDDPFGQLSRMFDSDFFIPRVEGNAAFQTSRWSYQSSEDDESMTLSIDLPGVKATDLTVTTGESTVTVVASREGKEAHETYHIDSRFDASSASALLQDGVLSLTFAKLTTESKSKQIEIKTA